MIQAVIFDWAGTTVDYGCFAPVQAFQEAFAHHGVPVTLEETRKPMGMLKRDHIRTMLRMERIARAWEETHGRPAGEEDVEAVYALFEPKLFSILDRFSTPKPFAVETAAALREMGLKIGSTTGYTDSMMHIVAPKAARLGYAPDFWISPDGVGGRGRPDPYMIFENLKALEVSSVKNAVKVGDTVSDIQEGVSAGVWSVGVIEGSSVLGLSQGEYEPLAPEERTELYKNAIESARDQEMNEAVPVITSAEDDMADFILPMLGITAENTSSFAVAVSAMNVRAYGIAAVMPAAGEDEAVLEGLNSFIENQRQSFEQYLADQYEVASAARLETLDGIGPTLAERIVAYREEHGPFADWEEFCKIQGIGESLVETLRPVAYLGN